MTTKKTYAISAAAGALAALMVILLFSFFEHRKPTREENEAYLHQINERYRIYSLPLPEKMEFAGEPVPMDQWDVREKVDREMLVNTYWHSNTLLSIKRAHRWFPVIEKVLAENDVPNDFKYLALIESGLTNVVSPSGATGFWQFLEGTGKEYGLEINEEVDERYHVEKSTKAACNFLREAHDKFGSWAMAAASYNMGKGGLDRQVERQQENNYWDLLLNDETGRYVFRILALKELLNHADSYGFVIRPADLYEPLKFKTVEVDSTINDFADFSHHFGITYKALKLCNPWLRQGSLKNKDRKMYLVSIPE